MSVPRWLTAAIGLALAGSAGSARASPCDAGCTVVLTGDARKDVTGPLAQGSICLAAGDVTQVVVHDLAADAGPLTVRTCDGTVRVTGGNGLTLRSLDGVRVTGDDGDGGVAWVVDGQRTLSDAVTISGCIGALEVDHLEVHDVLGAGLRAEAQSCPGSLHLHDLWAHDVSGDGLAVGGDAGWARVEVEHARVDRTGAQGLRVDATAQALVHDDVVSSAGLVTTGSGLWVGPMAAGLFERDVVLQATGPCASLGSDGALTLRNSLLVDCAQQGVAVTGTGHSVNRAVRVVHSTIVRPGTIGVTDSSTGAGSLTVGNTLVVDLGAGRPAVSVGPTATEVGTLAVPSDAGFSTRDVTDPTKAKGAWRLGPISPARDTGAPLTPPVLDDLEQLGRDNRPDVGAHEFAGRLGVDGGVSDAGVELDAGVADAGPPETDGGSTSSDGGHNDLPDGGEINPMPPMASGCGCSTFDRPAAMLVGALLLSWRRRR